MHGHGALGLETSSYSRTLVETWWGTVPTKAGSSSSIGPTDQERRKGRHSNFPRPDPSTSVVLRYGAMSLGPGIHGSGRWYSGVTRQGNSASASVRGCLWQGCSFPETPLSHLQIEVLPQKLRGSLSALLLLAISSSVNESC